MIQIPPRAKILLIKLRSIGDVVYNTAVYAPIKKCFPDAHLTVLVEKPSYGLVCRLKAELTLTYILQGLPAFGGQDGFAQIKWILCNEVFQSLQSC